MQPFTCPHCGSHTYVIVLRGCALSNATLQETFLWNEAEQDYASTGTVLADAEDLTPQDSQGVCGDFEQDVTEALSAYEASLSPSEDPAGA